MRKLCLLLVAVFSLVFVSCEFEEVDLGFPKIVNFTNEGGEKVICGSQSFTHANIHNYKNGDQGKIQESDSISIFEYDWLRIEYKDLEGKHFAEDLKIIAQPNSTNKSLELNIEVTSGKEYQVITVKQDK